MKLRKILLFLGIVLVIFVAIWQIRQIRGIGENKKENFSYAKVKQVVDGDTIKLESGETVRYIGIDSPEIYGIKDKQSFSSNKKDTEDKGAVWTKVDKCYSQEAKKRNEELVLGKDIKLQKDISEKDKFGRLLRYVWMGETFVNLELVKLGCAVALTIPPDVKYENEILQLGREAKTNNLGLWSACK